MQLNTSESLWKIVEQGLGNHTHTDSYLVMLRQEGNKPLGKNCVAGLVSQVFKDESDVLSVKSFLYLWLVEALSGT